MKKLKPIGQLKANERILGLNPRRKSRPKKASKKQTQEVLMLTKQVNGFKEKRNRCSKGSIKYRYWQDVILAAEKNLSAARKKYNIPII